MAKESLWITAQKNRAKAIRERKNQLIIQLEGEGFSFGEIESIVRVNKGTAHRIVKTASKPVATT